MLKREYEGFEGVQRAKTSNFIPTVLSREEIDAVIRKLKHPFSLIVKMQFGCGLRLAESVNIRLNCLDFENGILTIHDGKGKKDRTVPLPKCLEFELKQQIERAKNLHREDVAAEFAGVFMPSAVSGTYKQAAKDLPWQWLFSASTLTYLPEENEYKRYHTHEKHVSNAIRTAAREIEMMKRVTAHTFRHSFASHLLQNNFDIRTIQQLMRHGSIKTTMRYLHTVPVASIKEPMSPLDL
ncbi:tyrosine-type recombinase/integrase [Puniceicoccaceae bacterium K14]|nr:tyrosine-type recombinase/integrase [Puniceicoccaceae bacterium K14]